METATIQTRRDRQLMSLKGSALKAWREDGIVSCALSRIRGHDRVLMGDQWVRRGFKPGTIVRHFAILSPVFTVARWGLGRESSENRIRDTYVAHG